jgi:hypothetical protein
MDMLSAVEPSMTMSRDDAYMKMPPNEVFLVMPMWAYLPTRKVRPESKLELILPIPSAIEYPL